MAARLRPFLDTLGTNAIAPPTAPTPYAHPPRPQVCNGDSSQTIFDTLPRCLLSLPPRRLRRTAVGTEVPEGATVQPPSSSGSSCIHILHLSPQQTRRAVQVYACCRARVSFLKVRILTYTIRHQGRVSRTGREYCSPRVVDTRPCTNARGDGAVGPAEAHSGASYESEPCLNSKAVAQCGAAARRSLPLPVAFVLLRRAVYVTALGRAQRTRLRRRKMLCSFNARPCGSTCVLGGRVPHLHLQRPCPHRTTRSWAGRARASRGSSGRESAELGFSSERCTTLTGER
ncbi:hypothetical protein C8Q73DRAFT_225256 [Cubamyces lactineus]|nr:hypothetical protein C8Q73DRAFT_225256 [Cubamyces lactineus]